MRAKKIKTCFIISPVGEFDSETRKRSDRILKHVITPALKRFNYRCIRADQISEPGNIVKQVNYYLLTSPLVMADLTGQNPNVYYELGIRHSTKMPVIHIIEKGEKIAFDISVLRVIQFDSLDIDSVTHARSEVEKQIKLIESGKTDYN